MASENRHITRIRDTQANVRANLDLGQSAILTDLNEEWVYMNDPGTRLYYMSNQYYWDGAAIHYCDAIHSTITAIDDIYVGDEILHLADTDTRISFSDDSITMRAGGLEFIQLLEQVAAQDFLNINPGYADIDFLVFDIATVALSVVASSGFVGVHTDLPEYQLHILVGDSDGTADAGADDFVIESDADAGLSVLVGADGTAMLFFADDNDTGKITWANDAFRFYPDGSIYNLLINASTVWVNPTGGAVDFKVNWDSGVGLFVQGSDGVVGVGTATLQTWKTATYESVLSFGSAGKCAIAGDGSTLDIVSDAYYDVTNSRWEHGTAATGSARIALSDGVYMYIPDGTGNPGDPLTWLEIFEAKYTGAAAGLVHINALKAGAFYLKVSQKSTAAQPCVYLEQDDASEGYIDFIGTMCAVCNTSSVGSLRMEVNGTVYRFQVFPDTDL